MGFLFEVLLFGLVGFLMLGFICNLTFGVLCLCVFGFLLWVLMSLVLVCLGFLSGWVTFLIFKYFMVSTPDEVWEVNFEIFFWIDDFHQLKDMCKVPAVPGNWKEILKLI